MYKCFTFILVENHYSSELVEVQKRMRKKFYTAKLLYGEPILRRNFRTVKYPYDEIFYGEISFRRNFLTVKFPNGETPYGEISYGEISGHG